MTDHVLSIATHAHPAGPTVLTVAGELDYHTGGRLRQALEKDVGGRG